MATLLLRKSNTRLFQNLIFRNKDFQVWNSQTEKSYNLELYLIELSEKEEFAGNYKYFQAQQRVMKKIFKFRITILLNNSHSYDQYRQTRVGISIWNFFLQHWVQY